MAYQGDYAENATIHFTWDTSDANGASITRATDGSIVVYKDNGATEITAGITDVEDFDSLTGVHACTIDSSADAAYTPGADYSVVLKTATIDGQTVNATIGSFSIENRSGSAPSVWNRVLSAAKHNIPSSAGRRLRTMQITAYEGGAIWIDTVSGSAGTDPYENGTPDNPVDSLADAITLSASTGIPRFKIAPGSSISLSQAFDGYLFDGRAWTLDLNGQDVSNSIFLGASVSGTCAGATGMPEFCECFIGTITVPPCRMERCGIQNGIVAQAIGDFFFDACYSEVAGVGTPSFDFGALGSQNLNFRHYSGGIELKQMGVAGTDRMSLEGDGQIVVNANCTGGTVVVRGHFTKDDNSGGAVTFFDDARIDVAQIAGAGISDLQSRLPAALTGGKMDSVADVTAIDGSTTAATKLSRHARLTSSITFSAVAATITTATLVLVDGAAASGEDDQYADRLFAFDGGTPDLDRVVTECLSYDGATKVATFAAIPVAVDATTTAVLV